MKVEIKKSIIDGCINAIPSKSFLIRALIISALQDKPCKINGLYMSNDVVNTINVLKALGTNIDVFENYCIVTPRPFINNSTINVGESATLLRLIIPVILSKDISARIYAEGSLLSRDILSQFDILKHHGATISCNFPLDVSGHLTGRDFYINDYSTSGIISGLMIALSQSGGKIIFDKESVNFGYLDITKSVLESFGQTILSSDTGFEIIPFKLGCDEYTCEGDYSNAGAIMALGALSRVKVEGLNPFSVQSDRDICCILNEIGANVDVKDNSITVSKNKLCPISIDMSKNLDIVNCVSALLAMVDGESILKNVGALRIKESDRIAEITRLLGTFGIKAELIDNNLHIYGGKIKEKVDYIAPSDHRLVMAGVILGLNSGCTIDNAECINKSYPTFFDDVKRIGGNVCII